MASRIDAHEKATGRTAYAAVDVAATLHPASHLTQIEGGVAMGLDFACLEDLGIEEDQDDIRCPRHG